MAKTSHAQINFFVQAQLTNFLMSTTKEQEKQQYASIADIPLKDIIPVLIGDNADAKEMLVEIVATVEENFGSLINLVQKINDISSNMFKRMLKKRCGQDFVDAFVFALDVVNIMRMRQNDTEFLQ